MAATEAVILDAGGRDLRVSSPARVIHHARRIILRLPAGLPSAPAFQAAYTAARGLDPPPLAA